MFPEITRRIAAWADDDAPPWSTPVRAGALQQLRDWVQDRGARGLGADIVWVCTHNSRRSHMAQLWGAAVTRHRGLHHVRTHSAGTEQTALFPATAHALRAHGFRLRVDRGSDDPTNPVYEARLGAGPPLRLWSKVLTHPSLPTSDFAAVMVCTSADEACPVVPGAALRLALPYADPKHADGTSGAEEAYLRASQQIGCELAHGFCPTRCQELGRPPNVQTRR